MLANPFVFAHRQVDQVVASEAGALASESSRFILIAGPLTACDPVVHIAERRLGSANTPLELSLHGQSRFSRASAGSSRITQQPAQTFSRASLKFTSGGPYAPRAAKPASRSLRA